MLFVDNLNVTDPRINLAVEEFLLRNIVIDEPLLMFYINEPSIIIGRNQNTLEEIDPAFVKANGIHVVRRLSGGGTVYHDLGNLNFSFITTDQRGLQKFELFTKPVIRMLGKFGIEAVLQGRSSIFAAGKKISGNAQYASRGRMFSHGTLLFDTNLENMLKAINPRQVKIESRAVQSVRSHVVNLRELLPTSMTISDLKLAILSEVFDTYNAPTFVLTEENWQEIRQIAAEKYMTWEWNIGRSPRFSVQKKEHLSVGKVDLRIDVERGHIKGLELFGNFFGRQESLELSSIFTGVRYDPDALERALNAHEDRQLLAGLDREEFLRFLY